MRSRSVGRPRSGHPRPTSAGCHRDRFGGSHWTHPIVKHIFTGWRHTPRRQRSPEQRVATRKSPRQNEYPTLQRSERAATTSARRGGKESGKYVRDRKGSERSFPTAGFWRFVATGSFRPFAKRLMRLQSWLTAVLCQNFATSWRKTSYMRTGICPNMTMNGVQDGPNPDVQMCQ